MSVSITIDLPETLLEQLESTAHRQHRSVADVLREFVIDNWKMTPQLPDDVEAELAALVNLSDETLWLLACSTLATKEQQHLARLNQDAKERALTAEENSQRAALLDKYDRTMVRRAQAAFLLKNRGHDLSDPAVLRPQ